MRIDSHQHFWKYDPVQYPWIGPGLQKLRRDFLPADLLSEWERVPLEASIAVQARQTLEETHWLLDLAARHPRIQGVVGWVDLRSPRVEEDLAPLAENPKFVGVRHVVQDESDPEFLLREPFLRGISKLRQFNLRYDLLIFPHQLPAAIEFVGKFPDQPFILDHLAKPRIRDSAIEPWKRHLSELARAENVACKLSGMVTEADWLAWREDAFAPYLEVVADCFGPDRLLFGSDWPVCLAAASYEQVYSLVDRFLQKSSDPVRAKVFGENARRIYRLPD